MSDHGHLYYEYQASESKHYCRCDKPNIRQVKADNTD
jgi:hypothetical protein